MPKGAKRPKRPFCCPDWQRLPDGYIPANAGANSKGNIHNKHPVKNNKTYHCQQINFQHFKHSQNKTAVYRQQFLLKNAVYF